MQDITNMISMVGFPIFCTLALGGFVYKAFQSITGSNQAREAKLYEMLGETRAQLEKAMEVNASFVEVLTDLKNNVDTVQDDIVKIKSTLKLKDEKKGV